MLIRMFVVVCLLLQPLLGFAATVKEVQEMLKDLGYLSGKADGRWGSKSKEALKRFQTDNALPATGGIDAQTTQKLESVVKEKSVVKTETATPPQEQPQEKQADTKVVDNTAVASTVAVPETSTIVAKPKPPEIISPPPVQHKQKDVDTTKYPAPIKSGIENITESPDGISFVRIPGGCFVMGDNRENDSKPHEICVHVGGSFLLGQYEVTQGQWLAITGSNPSALGGNPNYPVENVSWSSVHDFIEKLNVKGQGKYRLPTEAEWEYSARAGSKAAYWWGDAEPVCDPASPNGANFQGGLKCPNGITPVGTYKPNPFGLYDVHGNVWEWVEDIYVSDAYNNHSKNDPVVTEGGTERVFRGGSWLYPATAATAFHRDHAAPAFQFSHLGFRLIYEPK